jgi:hypothetical protein
VLQSANPKVPNPSDNVCAKCRTLATAAKKIDAEYGRGVEAKDAAGNGAAAAQQPQVVHQITKAGAGAFLQAMASSGVTAVGRAASHPPQQQQFAQRRTTTLSAAPVRKRDYDASGVPVAGDASYDLDGSGGAGAEDPDGKRLRGDEHDAWAGGAAAAAGDAAGVPFIPSSYFAGAKPGYCFKEGGEGLGYYVDTQGAPPAASAAAAAAAAAAGGYYSAAPPTPFATAVAPAAPPPVGRPLDYTGPMRWGGTS